MRKFYNLLVVLSVSWCAAMPLQTISAENPTGLTVATQSRKAARLDQLRGANGADNMSVMSKLPTVMTVAGSSTYKQLSAKPMKFYQMPAEGRSQYFRIPLRKSELSAMSTYYAVLPYSAATDAEVGIYSFEPFSNVANFIRTHDDLTVNGGATYIGNNEYFCTSYETAYGGVYLTHMIFNTETWTMTMYNPSGSDMATIARDLAYDPDTDLCYGVTYNHNASALVFSAVNPRTCTAEIINSDIPESIFAITFDDKGQLWGIGISTGTLYSIDKFTGTMTAVASTGLTTTYLAGGCFDPANGTMLVSTMENGFSALYSVDLQTGEATEIYEYPNNEEVVGMFVKAAEAADAAPAAPEDLTVNFPAGSLTGTVTFTMPSTCFDESDLTGNLNYVVKFNGVKVAEGTAGVGDEVDETVTVESPGDYYIVVQAVNDNGESPRVTTSLYIGEDLPGDIASVDMEYTDGNFVLTWDPVTESVNNGYFDPEKLTYKVTRFSNDAVDSVVAENLTESTFSDPVAVPDELTVYYYQVAPVYDGQTLSGTETKRMALGVATPDVNIDFRVSDKSYYTTVINGNSDSVTWKWAYDYSYSFEYCGMMQISNIYTHSNNDYLFTCPFRVEAGREYTFQTMLEQTNKYCPANYAVYLAKSPTADGVCQTLVETTTLENGEVANLSIPFTLWESGDYYICIYTNMTSGRYGLNCYYLNILRGPMGEAPYYPGLTVETDPSGLLKANCTLTVPTMSVAGDDLEEIESPVTRVVVSRNGEEIYVNENPPAGGTLNFTDTPSEEGEYTYTAVAYNKSGEGYKRDVVTYIGVALPNHPTNAYGYQTANIGEVELNWDLVTTDIYGSQRDPSLVFYSIASKDSGSWTIFDDEITEPPYLFDAASSTAEQEFHQYLILANTSAGINTTGAGTGLIPVGVPYETPYYEPFSQDGLAYILASGSNNTSSSWGLALDNDECYLRYGAYVGDIGTVYTGLINVNCDDPELRFNVMNFDGCESTFDVLISTNSRDYQELASGVAMNDATRTWRKYSFDLSSYKGQVVNIAIRANIQNKVFCMDDMSIKPSVKKDLSVTAISASNEVSALGTATVKASVYNNANSEADFTAELYCDGKCVDSQEVKALAADATTEVVFEHTPGLFVESDQVSYYVKVILDGDENEDDNLSATVNTTVVRPTYPTVGDLAEDTNGNSRLLTWSAPELGGNEVVTDDVEAYPAFSIGWPSSAVDGDTIGDWTGVCECEEEVKNTYFPAGYGSFPNYMCNKAVMVFNPSEIGIDYEAEVDEDEDDELLIAAPYYRPHSGNQYFAMYDNQYCESNDYLISPKLSGTQQTISFYAQTFQGEYGEQTVEFLTSSNGTDIDDFEVVDTFDLPVGWTYYEFELPEGTNYFAIHNISDDIFCLFIDDITYEVASPYSNLEIAGYNVYCNGIKLTDEPIDQTEYIIPLNDSTNRTYYVTVVYSEGESDLSNAVTIDGTTGLVDVMAEKIIVAGGKGEIIVRGAVGKDVMVFAADGKTIASKTANSTVMRLPVVPGVYVVNVSGQNFKVVVR